ncbi:MAG: excinuclease ABC subunit UvrA [Planctomycetales bacterium]|jgi:excinuclease ABC subunit A
MHDGNEAMTGGATSMTGNIELRGVRVHNLQSIDLDVPLNKLTVITGVSGSGKSSLAFDTLYAEGQRRYIESFSSSARRHLDRLEKPDADSIAHIPPAVALRQNAASQAASRRSTIATVTEVDDLLRVLFARVGVVICPTCELPVDRDSSGSIAEAIGRLPAGLRLQFGFPLRIDHQPGTADGSRDAEAGTMQTPTELLESGFTRAVTFGAVSSAPQDESRTELSGRSVSVQELSSSGDDVDEWPVVIVDRLVSGKTTVERIVEASETSLRESDGRCVVLVQADSEAAIPELKNGTDGLSSRPMKDVRIDGDSWQLLRFSSNFDCSSCGKQFVKPEPSMLSFRSPLGACSICRGTGSVSTIDFNRMVPDQSLSLRAGAIVALRGDRWKRERERLLRFAENAGVPLDVEFRELTPGQKEWVYSGNVASGEGSTRGTEGLRGLIYRLERRKQLSTTREFLSQWRQIDRCESCSGTRLRPEALAVKIAGPDDESGGKQSVSISDLSAMTVDELLEFLQAALNFKDERSAVGLHLVADITERLKFLESSGLGYIHMNRDMASLSRGEAQRVAMTSIAGSNLVNTLFVIDEPSAGLHPRDVARVVSIVESLRESGNTVVVVEHETDFLAAADHVVDIGPAAGQDGGQLVYSGHPSALPTVDNSATGQWLARTHSKGDVDSSDDASEKANRRTATGWLRLRDATCHNVSDCSVELPLGVLCVVTGVSGAGKSSLIENVLYPALCQASGQPCSIEDVGEYGELIGKELVSSVELIDDRPLAGSRRSNPATWLKVFDEIRRLFAETEDARNRNLTASHFSFNTDTGGRCNKCEGTGRVEIDMQFLADVSMTCPDCNGTRYQSHILDVQWRARTIADVLAMTAAEAFPFFRGQTKIQKRLRSLKDVGLDYLTLGQPLATLSGGEAQRLKLAACLASSSQTGSLLIMNEPTTGLHPADVVRLLECFEGLLSVGHSLLVIEHHLDVIRSADHIIDIGPEAGPGGGQVVATGSVADIATCPESITGKYLCDSPS